VSNGIVISAFDIAILGAGPAGIATALGLNRLGYGVAVLGRARPYPALEGLADRARIGLAHLGCRQALAAPGVRAERDAYWNGTRFSGNHEWLIDRAPLDTALGNDARDAGVILLDGRVEQCRRQAPLWRIDWRNPEGKPATVTACWLIEARGRSASRQRDSPRGPLTVALAQHWQLARSLAASTGVIPHADGWLWFATLGDGTALVQWFGDARLPPKARLERHYRTRLAAVPEAREWLAGAHALGELHARQAYTQRAADPITEHSARVGDAALAIDPLSGHGIYQALAGALTLIPVVNTLLQRPERATLARAFYRERMVGDFLRLARLGRDFYRQEQRWPDRPFWQARQSWPDEAPVHAEPDSAPVRIETRPVSRDDLIESREVVVSADHPRGLWQVAGVELVPLLHWRRAQTGIDDGRAARHYAENCARPPEACLAALKWLRRYGLLDRELVGVGRRSGT
jgi:flavin-dependent dehydrogenase